MSTTDIEVGIKGLDRVVGYRFKYPSLLVVGGHPGAGKTTFALTMCVHNARKGKKCLYVTFQERMEKLAGSVGLLGDEFLRLTSEGKIRYSKLPVTLDTQVVIESISREVAEFAPRIVVVDSINVLLESVKANRRMRALLQNFFYELPYLINGLVILLAELPFGESQLGLGDIEFVADGLIILKYRYEDSIIVRELEIRKFRGIPVKAAQFPFSITEKGIRVYPPTSIKGIRKIDKITLRTASEKLDSVSRGIRLGEIVSVFYPPCCAKPQSLVLLLDALKRYNLKGMIISYWLSVDEIKYLLKFIFQEDFEIPPRETSMIIEKFMDERLKVVSINPLGMGYIELGATEIEEIEKANPDVVAYIYPEILEYIYKDKPYFRYIIDKLLYLKRSGKLIVNLINKINPNIYNAYLILSDVAFDLVATSRYEISRNLYLCVSRGGVERKCFQYNDVVNAELLRKLHDTFIGRGDSVESDLE